MKNGKFANKKRRGFGSKSLALLLALMLLVGTAVGGTLAWLTASTKEVSNTFSPSDITITLDETMRDEDTETDGKQANFDMIPGWALDKDPRVTVVSGSEDCYLFIEVNESANLRDYINYTVNTTETESKKNNVIFNGWTKGTGTGEGGNGVPANVYFRKVNKSTADQVFGILEAGSADYNEVNYTWAKDQVLTLPTVTKEMMEALTEDTKPYLTFTAYASQLYKSQGVEFTAGEAWNNVPRENNG